MKPFYRTIVDDVAELIRGGSYSQSVDVFSAYVPPPNEPSHLPKNPPWRVDVISRGISGGDADSQFLTECNYSVGVFVRGVVPDLGNDELIDELLLTVEQIQDRLSQNPILINGGVLIPPFENEPNFDPGLRETRVLTSLSVFTYRIDRG